MKNSVSFLIAAICGTTMVVASSADIVLDENFDRADGSLVGTSPTPGPGGVWASHSGTLGDLLISGGQALVQHGVPSEDAHATFTLFTAGLLTANFDLVVTDDTPILGGDYEYFAHFMQEGTFAFLSRLDVVPANAAGDYTLGIATSSSTAETIFPTDFTYGAPINVSLGYDFASGLSSVTVGGTTITSTTPVLGATVDSFALRQSDSSNNETILVDNLTVTHIPEPGTLALLGLGGLLIALRRRR